MFSKLLKIGFSAEILTNPDRIVCILLLCLVSSVESIKLKTIFEEKMKYGRTAQLFIKNSLIYRDFNQIMMNVDAIVFKVLLIKSKFKILNRPLKSC